MKEFMVVAFVFAACPASAASVTFAEVNGFSSAIYDSNDGNIEGIRRDWDLSDEGSDRANVTATAANATISDTQDPAQASRTQALDGRAIAEVDGRTLKTYAEAGVRSDNSCLTNCGVGIGDTRTNAFDISAHSRAAMIDTLTISSDGLDGEAGRFLLPVSWDVDFNGSSDTDRTLVSVESEIGFRTQQLGDGGLVQRTFRKIIPDSTSTSLITGGVDDTTTGSSFWVVNFVFGQTFDLETYMEADSSSVLPSTPTPFSFSGFGEVDSLNSAEFGAFLNFQFDSDSNGTADTALNNGLITIQSAAGFDYFTDNNQPVGPIGPPSTLASVPLPSAGWLLLAAICGLWVRRGLGAGSTLRSLRDPSSATDATPKKALYSALYRKYGQLLLSCAIAYRAVRCCLLSYVSYAIPRVESGQTKRCRQRSQKPG